MDDTDRVRAHTAPKVNRCIDQGIETRVQEYAGKDSAAITQRLDALEREWDIERALETTASTLGMSGLLLGAGVNKRWLLFPAVVLGFLFQHAVQGWCPPLVLFRQLGVRTRREIDRERYALKALRGDFERVALPATPAQRAKAALDAVAPNLVR
jgi:hypothetical protein